MTIEQQLAKLGLRLPATATPGSAYAAAVVQGDLAFISGQLPREGDTLVVVGKLGLGVSLEEGRKGAQISFLRTLAALRDTLGSLDRLDRVVKLTVFVNSAPDFTQHSQVADAASALIYDIFGPERGHHARTSVGVAALPRDGAVEVETVFALRAQ